MAAQRKVLLVDDDQALAETLAEQLTLHMEVTLVRAATATEALETAESGDLDVILLDVGLPDMDGRELCKVLRRRGITVPIVMLTAADSDADAILGLDSGANDYVTKPFRLGVLMARLRAQLRQVDHSEDARFTLGPYMFHPATKRLIEQDSGRQIRLTEKETAILRHLFRAQDRQVSRETLLTEVWGYNAQVDTHTLETHIYRLRRKIEPDPAQAQLLRTVTGGYRLTP